MPYPLNSTYVQDPSKMCAWVWGPLRDPTDSRSTRLWLGLWSNSALKSQMAALSPPTSRKRFFMNAYDTSILYSHIIYTCIEPFIIQVFHGKVKLIKDDTYGFVVCEVNVCGKKCLIAREKIFYFRGHRANDGVKFWLYKFVVDQFSNKNDTIYLN